MPEEISVTDLEQLSRENEELRLRLNETEETLSAIRNGQVDAIIVSGSDGEKIFSLTSAETQYRLILEQMNEGAVVVSTNGLVLFCNRRFSDIAGTPQEQIIGSGITGLIEVSDRRNFKKLLRSGLSGNARGKVTFKMNQIHTQLSFVALSKGAEGVVCIIVSDITDMTNQQILLQDLVEERSAELEELNRQLTSEVEELKRSRKKLKISARKYSQLLEKMTVSEARYRLLFEKMNEGFAIHEIITDKNGIPCDYRFLDANPSFEKLTGLRISEVKQKRVFEVLPSFEKFWVDNYGKAAHGGNNSNFEYYSTPWGKHFKVSAFYPQPGQFATIFEDITQRKLAEDELRDSREKLEIALETAHVGIWEWNLNTDRITLDHRMQEILGAEPDRYCLAAGEFENLIHEEDVAHFRKARNLTTKSGELMEAIFRTRPLNGESKYLSTRALLTFDEEGSPVSLTGVCFDITGMKKGAEKTIVKLNEDLLRSNRELESFAYVASHDLQEPLRMISSFTQMLDQRYGDKLDQDAHDYIGFAVEGAKRMYDLLNGLLAYSRIQSKGREFSDVDMSVVLEKVTRNLSLLISERNAGIIRNELPVIRADESQIIQLVQNLFENSIKFSPGNPRITFTATTEPDRYLFSVKDEGIGIDPIYFDRIFKLFQRLESKEDYEGTGIGLAICKRIVDRHNGKIWVESEPGKGSVFYFSIPRKSSVSG